MQDALIETSATHCIKPSDQPKPGSDSYFDSPLQGKMSHTSGGLEHTERTCILWLHCLKRGTRTQAHNIFSISMEGSISIHASVFHAFMLPHTSMHACIHVCMHTYLRTYLSTYLQIYTCIACGDSPDSQEPVGPALTQASQAPVVSHCHCEKTSPGAQPQTFPLRQD